MSTNFNLKLIAPDGVKYDETATEAILPTDLGQIAILPNHMPLISLLRPGEIIIKNGTKEHHLATEGGIIEVADNVVKILADTAEDADSLDELKIIEAKKAAEQSLRTAVDSVDYANAAAQIEKQLAKLQFINRRKKYKK
ncbi:ATP synthase F1 subunit epsilon [Candidatus Berkelbacteria bacterium CG10_big_fil_rev_8_21_14_0_10_43_13]|uniref:ATP synthase epsilon chain n=1 Tax=Candidatus Berkelbacteria bacterium CG10_big_fil_rev_8_21_14_0_10_43_13 TaxID=1974514 RepID=A0A2H0W820_9BACT|nr:ATP synthase F1 subunit epsilon [bacterium]PIS07497.1 MAG: ATP synthase F1 subunit epsilon [Candidatus Berkelbacteria bacterium CG10_big_fil_rev_8_21_14_0_10_43_13]